MRVNDTKKMITVFLGFAFGLPAVCIFLFKNFTVFQSGNMYFILYGIAAMTPSIAAIATSIIFTGSTGVKELLKKSYLDNIKLGYIALAIMLPLMVLLITKLTASFFIAVPFVKSITLRKILIISWALIAEELGWRGFLQEKLNKYSGHILTPVLVGVIWSLWHYHFIIWGTFSAPISLFVIGCIADSFGYYWITKKSNRNIIPASIWHFTGNLFFNLFMINPEYNKGSMIPYLFYIVYICIMAVAISFWGITTSKKVKA